MSNLHEVSVVCDNCGTEHAIKCSNKKKGYKSCSCGLVIRVNFDGTVYQNVIQSEVHIARILETHIFEGLEKEGIEVPEKSKIETALIKGIDKSVEVLQFNQKKVNTILQKLKDKETV